MAKKLYFQAKENAEEILRQKLDLEKEMRALEEAAVTKENALQQKLKTIGNYVHESVPVSDNEVLTHEALLDLAL